MRFPRTIFPALAVLALATGVGLLPSCGSAPRPTGPRLVVLYATCTVSKDFLSPYGHRDPESDPAPIDFTPNLQRFADEGTVFERHNTEAGQSGVAFASIFTGVQADRHGVYFHPDEVPAELLDVSEAFAANGYAPHVWSGQAMAAAKYGYGQAVPESDVHYTHVEFTKRAKELPAGFFPETTANTPEFDAILEELQRDPDAGAFVQVNFTITHELYHEYADLEKIEAFRRAHPAHATDLSSDEIAETLRFFEENRHRLQLNHEEAVRELGMSPEDVDRLDAVLQLTYKACVAQLDHWFGVFLDRIDAAGLKDDSLIAFTADHGETFYHESEPFHWMHGLQLAPSVIGVPWILRGSAAGVPAGARYGGVTRSIDVYPTMLGLCDGSLPDGYAVDGVDLTGAVRGGKEPRLFAFSHTSTLGEARVKRYAREKHTTAMNVMPKAAPEFMWVRVRDGDMIFEQRRLSGEDMQLVAFDLATDPWRSRDVFDAADEEHARMAERLAAYRKRLTRNYDSGSFDQKEALAALRGLGYVGDD